jgi:hypothetical protein
MDMVIVEEELDEELESVILLISIVLMEWSIVESVRVGMESEMG